MALIVIYFPSFYSLALSIHESQTHLPIQLMKAHGFQSIGYNLRLKLFTDKTITEDVFVW